MTDNLKDSSKLPRVYRVTYEYEFFVLACSQEAAENADVDINDQEPDVFASKVNRSEVGTELMSSLPYLGNDMDSDESEELTLEDWFHWIEEGDKRRKAEAEFLAKQVPLPGVLT